MKVRNERIEEELFPFYALDALTGEERAEVDAYVAGDPEAQARLNALLATAADVAAAAPPHAPAPEVKARLMARVAADLDAPDTAAAPTPPLRERATPARPATPEPPRRRWFDLSSFFLGRAVAFAAILLLVGGIGLWQLARQSAGLRAQVAQLEAQTVALQEEVDDLRTTNEMLWDELAARDEVLAHYRVPGAVTIAIGDATGDLPAAVGTLTLDPAGGGTLAVANLPPPEEGTTYQAWLIVGETPVSAGTFNVDPTGRALHPIPDAAPGAFDAIGVSLEPAGGSDTPTDIVLLGSAGL